MLDIRVHWSPMSYWNYRVVRTYHQKEEISTFHIHEVYYDDDDKIERWSMDPMDPFGNTFEDIQIDVEHMLEAFTRPVLTEVELDGKTILTEDEKGVVLNNKSPV